jgi:hypothetical protein
MPSRIEVAERETARVTTSHRRAKGSLGDLYRLWGAFRSEPLATALWPDGPPNEPPKVLVDLAATGTRVLHEAIEAIGATPKAVTALIRDPEGEPPGEPTAAPAPRPTEPAGTETEWEREPEPVDPADAIEEKIRNLERTGLWDPGR